eukprot:g2399.t1
MTLRTSIIMIISATSLTMSSAFLPATDSALRYSGRVAVNSTEVLWSWPGVSVSTTLACDVDESPVFTLGLVIAAPSVLAPPFPEVEHYRVFVDGVGQPDLVEVKRPWGGGAQTVNVTLHRGNGTQFGDRRGSNHGDTTATPPPAGAAATTKTAMSVEIVKMSERMSIPIEWSLSEGEGATAFKGLVLPQGCRAVAAAPAYAAARLSATTTRPTRSIEFLGDSITCGFGNLVTTGLERVSCVLPNAWHKWEDFGKAFPRLLQSRFGAKAHTQCISQSGICRNGNTVKRTTPFNVTHYIHRTLPTVPEATWPAWNYSRFVPDVAVVNLGTNDYDIARHVPGNYAPSLTDFAGNYTALLVDYVSRYQGRLRGLVVACGPMTTLQCATVEHVVVPAVVATLEQQRQAWGWHGDSSAATAAAATAAAAAATTTPVVRYTNVSLPSERLQGCLFHPDVRGHVLLADQLAQVIADVTGWD